MFSRFFVRRPVFAWVIAILIMLAGILAIRTLPVAQYPDVAPPTIKISATYTGASAETLENSVTQVIEQQLTGLDNLLYFSSTSSSDGSVSINVTFEQGTDPDTAQVQVQNKIQQAESRLPSEVQQTGVTVEKSQSNFLLPCMTPLTKPPVRISPTGWSVTFRTPWRVLKVWGVCKSLARNTLCASGSTRPNWRLTR